MHAVKTDHSAFQHPRKDSHSSKTSPQFPIPDSREVSENERRSLSSSQAPPRSAILRLRKCLLLCLTSLSLTPYKLNLSSSPTHSTSQISLESSFSGHPNCHCSSCHHPLLWMTTTASQEAGASCFSPAQSILHTGWSELMQS